MLWRLQHRIKGRDEDWKDSVDGNGGLLPKFSIFTSAFEYFFRKHQSKRRPDLNEYRLTPEFSTKPKLVLFTPQYQVPQPGVWETEDHHHRYRTRG